jgi:DNA mismatch repair protein MutL
MLKGTEVTVADLFNSTPARKKFLRSLRTEYQHILDVILEHALAFPDIGFTFFSDGKLIVDLPKKQTFEERVEAVFGAQNFSNLFTFIKESDHIEISGFLSKPQLSTRVRNNQYIIVNNRSVRNELISGVIKKTYGSLLDHESFPVFILRVNVPFEMVDVNVHPRKEEVAFWDDEKLSTLLSNAVSEAINTHDLTYTSSVVGEPTEEYYRKPSTFVFDTLKEDVTPWDFYSEIGEDPNNILQVGKLYLVSVSKNGKNLQIIDQHAAHERILYEQFLDNLKNIKEENSTFILESPVLINLSLKDSTLLSEHLKLLENIGFHIENFGTQTYKIFSIPNILKDHNLEFLINELLDEIKINKLPSVPERKLLKTISYLSCRSAIKAGDYLTMEERRQLLEKLETTKSNYTCPHGRPVKFEMHMSGLAKMFKRIK